MLAKKMGPIACPLCPAEFNEMPELIYGHLFENHLDKEGSAYDRGWRGCFCGMLIVNAGHLAFHMEEEGGVILHYHNSILGTSSDEQSAMPDL